MENQLVAIGKRLCELRTVLEISIPEMARITGVSEADYLAHEEGRVDFSFTFLVLYEKINSVNILFMLAFYKSLVRVGRFELPAS